MTIVTARQLNEKGRRLDRVNRSVASVLKSMRAGAALHLEHHRSHERWWLSDGSEVPVEIARLAIKQPSIVSVGDSLFGFTPAQTYRYLEDYAH